MNRNRKRRNEGPKAKPSNGILIDSIAPPKESLVVDTAKVIQALARLSAADTPACIKVLVSDSEAQHFEGIHDSLTKDFSVSMTISASTECLDRIITIYGNLAECSRCSIYIGFILNSSLNNFAGSENYTLKSANYHLNVLVEASDLQIASLLKKFPAASIDVAPYETNTNLHAARLSGDFGSLFNSLTFIFSSYPYKKYASDENIEGLPVVGVYEKQVSSYDAASNHQAILNFVYDKRYLSGS